MPPLTIENAQALVAGGGSGAKENDMAQANPKSALAATVKGVAVRAFYYQGKVCERGKAYELPRLFALEMQAANKFTIVNDEPAPAPVAKAADKAPEKSPAKKGD